MHICTIDFNHAVFKIWIDDASFQK